MFSLSKVVIGEHSTPSKLWSLWVDTELGPIPVKIGTFKECWEERMKRYNMKRGVLI